MRKEEKLWSGAGLPLANSTYDATSPSSLIVHSNIDQDVIDDFLPSKTAIFVVQTDGPTDGRTDRRTN